MLNQFNTIDKQKIQIENRLLNLEKKLKNKSLNQTTFQDQVSTHDITSINTTFKNIKNNSFMDSMNYHQTNNIKDNGRKDTALKENNIQNKINQDQDHLYQNKSRIFNSKINDKHIYEEKQLSCSKREDNQMMEVQNILQKLMKSILAEQKHMREEIIEIKKIYSRDDTTRYQLQQQLSKNIIHKGNKERSFDKKETQLRKISQTLSHFNRDKDKKPNNQFQDRIVQNKKTKAYIQALEEDLKHKKRSVSKKIGVVRKNCPDKFQDLINLVKSETNRRQGIKITEQLKKKVWNKVKQRKVQSDKLFIEIIHNNNKHLHEHLVYTNQLQQKLKDDLTRKIYSTCNNLIYK